MEKKYLILTYGCQMNVHESEKLAGILENNGYVACNNAVEADVVVFNTCAIRESAEQKIFGNIGELKNIKLVKPEMIIAIGGCMSQQDKYASEIMQRFPFVDIVFGTHNLGSFEDLLKQRFDTNKRISAVVENEEIAVRDSMKPARTSGVNAWVNIMYGCNNFCTYCIVPYVRGREVSRPEKDILIEVESLLKEGYKQITLLGQNVNSYHGINENGEEIGFAKLLKDIDALDYEFRLRFMTSHPKDLSSEVIEAIAFYSCKKLVNINLPSTLKKLNASVFAYCESLKTIIIPNSVHSIYSYAFEGCSSLESVYIPTSVTTIQDYAFMSCGSCLTVYCQHASIPSGFGSSWVNNVATVLWGCSF